MRLSSIVIDVDGSPLGYVAWYNYYNGNSRIRTVKPAIKNDRFGVQRMEMLAMYFAVADNFANLYTETQEKDEQYVISIRSDSKSTVDQLQGISEIRDLLLKRVFGSIKNLLKQLHCTILFHHLHRTRNIAGLMLEQRSRKEKERHSFQYMSVARRFL